MNTKLRQMQVQLKTSVKAKQTNPEIAKQGQGQKTSQSGNQQTKQTRLDWNIEIWVQAKVKNQSNKHHITSQ